MIEIADLVKDLRSQLEHAIADAPQDGLRFEVGAAEIEVSVAVEKAASVGTKVKVWVIESGVDGTLAHTSTHKLKLTLLPKLDGASPFVSGDAKAGED
jgi:hypothetical protein